MEAILGQKTDDNINKELFYKELTEELVWIKGHMLLIITNIVLVVN